MNKWMTLAAIAALVFSMAGLRAETLQEAKSLQEAALAQIKAKGLDAAASDFNAGGTWKQGSLYIVVVKFDGTMIAHSANEKIVGKNMLEAKDASGKAFAHETIAAVKAKGSSELAVRWANPVSKQIADAVFVARRIPGHDAYIGSMIFR